MFERFKRNVNGGTDCNDIDWTTNLVSRGVNKFGAQGRRRVSRICNWWEQLYARNISSAAMRHGKKNSHVNNEGRSRSHGWDICRIRSVFA